MKNKHLVLLFLSALVIGWLLGRLPWTNNTMLPEVDLLRIDTAELVEISILRHGQPECILSRTDEGWICTQSGGSVFVPQGVISEVMAILHPLPAEQIVRTKRPDTIGLGPDQGVWVAFYQIGGRRDSIKTGYLSDGFTWVSLPGHEGIYRVRRDLSMLTGLTINQFQPGPLLEMDTAALEACSITIPPESFTGLLRFSDSLQCWIEESSQRRIHPDSMRHWLALLPLLNRSQTTSFFDESRRSERYRGMVGLHGGFGAISLRFYELPYPDLPEEMPNSQGRPALTPCYVVESTQRPHVYYAVSDTLLVHQILQYLLPANAVNQ